MKTMSRISALGLVVASMLAADAGAQDRETRRRGTGGDVRGIVQGEDGKPVENATVRLLHRGRDKELNEVDSDTTNEDGGFRFTDVRDGTYVVVGYAGRNNKQLRDRTTVTVENGKSGAPVSFTLRRGEEEPEERSAKRSDDARYSNLKGIARDRDGDPIKNATIRLLTRDNERDREKTIEEVQTDNKGRFDFYKVANGTYFAEIVDDKKGSRKQVKLTSGEDPERLTLTSR